MTGHSEPLPIAALLAQEPALRSLARHLLQDDHDAQDATQQSILRAIEKPPAQRQSLAAYLAAILRHCVLDLRRGARARRLREQQAARGEALTSTSEMVEREQMRRTVAEAVLALEEPYRTTVWLRFYEDLPPRDVARRMAVPVNTVRTRLQRAFDQLRSILDRRHGGERMAWRAALVPLAGMPAEGLLAISGAAMGSVMMKKVAVAGHARPDDHGHRLPDADRAGRGPRRRHHGRGDLARAVTWAAWRPRDPCRRSVTSCGGR